MALCFQENIKKFKQEADKFEQSKTFQTAQNRLGVLSKVKVRESWPVDLLVRIQNFE